jgi:hypothetical protein
MSKRIKERCWWLHIRPADQPSARLASVYLEDGGVSKDPMAFAKMIGSAVAEAMHCGIESYGDAFKEEVGGGRIRIELEPSTSVIKRRTK